MLFISFYGNALGENSKYCSNFYKKSSEISDKTILIHFEKIQKRLQELNPNYDFIASVSNRSISQGFFSAQSWSGIHLEIYGIKKNSNSEKKLYAAFSIVKMDDNSVIIEHLETHSLLAENSRAYAFSQTDQTKHKGISFSEFKIIKEWVLDYIKTNGFSRIVSIDQASFSVDRFYRFLGMKPKQEAFYNLEDYVKYLLGECRKIDCGQINTMENLSESLSALYFPSNIIDRIDLLFKNIKNHPQDLIYGIETEVKKNYDPGFTISLIKDSKNSPIGVKIKYEDQFRTFFLVPEQLNFIYGSILTWEGIGSDAKFLYLDL